MKVVIDGIIYQLQSRGGISRLYSEILPRMCQSEPLLHIMLLMPGQPAQSLPSHPRILMRSVPQVERFLRPWRLWHGIAPALDRGLERMLIGKTSGKVWHSTYFTMPTRWRGAQVVTVVDMIYELFPHLVNGEGVEPLRQRIRRCVQAADAVICISEITKKDLQQAYGVNSNKIHVVPLGCSATFRWLEGSSWSIPAEVVAKPFILYVGSRAAYKGFDTLLQAYSSWAERNEFTLVVVGRKWSVTEVNYLAERGLFEKVYLLGDVGDESLCVLYNSAEAFVYPSLYEGFGIPLLEAMACGCPVVASRIPSTIEVAGDVPIYFEPGKAEDLKDALDRILRVGRRSARISAGLERVKEYSWDRAAEQTLEVYKSLIE